MQQSRTDKRIKPMIGRLARKQLLWILAFSSLVTLLNTGMQLFIEYRNDTSYIEDQFKRVEVAHLDALTRSLWNFDDKQLETQLDSIMSLRDIVAIEVRERSGLTYRKEKHYQRNRAKVVMFDMIFKDKGREDLGTLEVVASYEGVYQRLKKRLFFILTTQALKTFCVSLFILYVINHLVMRHLATISKYTEEMDSATLGRRLALDRTSTSAGSVDELDQVVGALNTMSQRLQDDVVAQKKIEQSLRESEEKYREIFENAVEGFFQSTPEGQFISVNKAFASMFGYDSPDDLLTHINNIEHQFYSDPADRDRYQRAIGETGVIENFEFLAKRKDGSLVWICNNTRCYFDDGGNVIRYEGTVTDIHERKVAEQQREELQAQLLRAQKMESIGNLAGGIAHDFNNILAAIMGYTDLSLMDIEKGSQVEKNLKSIRKAGERARDLVKQILTFARQSDGQNVPVHVTKIAQEALRFIRSTIPSAIEINQSLESDSLVMGNPTQLNQILMNLCTNAAQAMALEGGVLRVCVEDIVVSNKSKLSLKGLLPGSYLQITVADTGIGISPEIAGRIYEPYFTTKKMGDGTGMGLAIVHGIVESWGGRIELESEEGKGSTFYIVLPVCSEHAADNSLLDTSVMMGGNESILFVDDEEAIAKTSSMLLERLGYNVAMKTDSVAALEMFRETPESFDLVITDMNMPDMTGDEMVRKMRVIRSDIPVILCTGYSERITDALLLEINVGALLNKPISRTELSRAVRTVLSREEA